MDITSTIIYACFLVGQALLVIKIHGPALHVIQHVQLALMRQLVPAIVVSHQMAQTII